MYGTSKKVILYSSYQTGDTLPGYVRFALKHLAETDFDVVLLTNKRELSADTLQFLNQNGIKLFLTENRGYDFGMWRRYLQQQAKNNATYDTILLVNDSIVYFQNNFAHFIKQAEENSADVVALTDSTEFKPHLQSFFLYIKQPALGTFYLHLFETPEQASFYDVVHRLEIRLSEKFQEDEITMASLFHTNKNALFAYRDIIAQGGGFVKRKLLQRRFTFNEKLYFIRENALSALNANYHSLVAKAGLAPDFQESWLPSPVESKARHAADMVWETPLHMVGKPLINGAIKLKQKLRRKSK